MGLLSRLGRGARNVMRSDVVGLGGIGSVLGATSAAMSGGDVQDIGRGALYGAAGGAGIRGLAALPGSLKLTALAPGLALPGIGGALAVNGDIDAAARKILMFADGDPARMERAADILYGGQVQDNERLGTSGRDRRRNIYGIGDADQAGTALSGTERDAALQRAYQILEEGR